MVNIGGIQGGSCTITTSNDVDTPRNFCRTIDIMEAQSKLDSTPIMYRDSVHGGLFIPEDLNQKPPEGYYLVEGGGATSHIVDPQPISFDSGAVTTVGELSLGEPSSIRMNIPYGTSRRMITIDSNGVMSFIEDEPGIDQTESTHTIEPVGGSGPGATSITIPGVIPGGVLGVGDGMEQPDNGVLDEPIFRRKVDSTLGGKLQYFSGDGGHNILGRTIFTGEGSTKKQEYLIETKDVLYYDKFHNVKIAKNATITYKVTGYEKRQVTSGRTNSSGVTTTYAAIFYEDFPIKKLHSIVSSHPIDDQNNHIVDINKVISISNPIDY